MIDMSRLSRILTPLVAATLLAAPTLSAQSAEQDVMAVVKRLFDGMRAGDSSMVRSVFHPQVRMITASSRDGEVRTEIEMGVEDFAKAVGTPHPQKWDERIWNEKIHINGPLASVWTDYAFFRGDTFSHCGIDHFLLVKDTAGTWKVIELSDTRRKEGCQQGGK